MRGTAMVFTVFSFKAPPMTWRIFRCLSPCVPRRELFPFIATTDRGHDDTLVLFSLARSKRTSSSLYNTGTGSELSAGRLNENTSTCSLSTPPGQHHQHHQLVSMAFCHTVGAANVYKCLCHVCVTFSLPHHCTSLPRGNETRLRERQCERIRSLGVPVIY